MVGCLVHNIGAYCFTVPPNLETGSNLTIQCLHHIIEELYEKYNGTLPPILYIQVDNCARENKNQYLFAYLGLLVDWNVFKKIELNYLPVGHTHEDIDQMFSRLI